MVNISVLSEQQISLLFNIHNDAYRDVNFQVGSSQQIGVSADAVQILINAGLMALDPTDGSHVITKSGFQFLLMETASQVGLLPFKMLIHSLNYQAMFY